MKKSLLIALAGLMLIAFTQCGSKEYRTAKKIMNSYKSDLKKAKTCDDLDKAEEAFIKKAKELKDFDEKKLSEKEQKKLKELTEETFKLEEEMDKKLCDD